MPFYDVLSFLLGKSGDCSAISSTWARPEVLQGLCRYAAEAGHTHRLSRPQAGATTRKQETFLITCRLKVTAVRTTVS